jgi:hypothetical protein
VFIRLIRAIRVLFHELKFKLVQIKDGPGPTPFDDVWLLAAGVDEIKFHRPGRFQLRRSGQGVAGQRRYGLPGLQ